MAMKIGVIADTHLKGPDPLLEKVVKDLFADAEMILHAGDLVAMEVLDAFQGREIHAEIIRL